MHMAQLILLPLTVSCFSKIQIGFTFLVPTHPGSPGKKDVLVILSFLSPPALGSITHVVVRITFTRAAPPAYYKKGYCYAGRRKTKKLPDSMDAGEPIKCNKLTLTDRWLEG